MVITDIPEKKIIRSIELKVNSSIYVGDTRYSLGKEKGSGGEGTVYGVRNLSNAVAKIYNNDACTERRRAKIQRIVSLGIHDKSICAPFAIVKDKKSTFAGYLMPFASGESLQNRLFNFDRDGFLGWTRRDLVELCLTVLRIIQDVYSIPNHRILIGDINLGNFIVRNPRDVSLVDFDSIQIDEFPCPVGKDEFTAPELLSNLSNRKDSLRSRDNEAFSIAILLFLILCNNMHPFSCRNGESPAINIIKGSFPYNADGSVSKYAPLGYWAFYWAALPSYIRSAFIQSFSSSNRTTVDEWIKLFERYHDDFSSIIHKSPFLDNIIINRFPSDFHPDSSSYCLCCHEPKPGNMLIDRLCVDCINAGAKIKTKKCKGCGREIIYAIKPRSKSAGPEYCDNCLSKVSVTCKACGKKAEVPKYLLESYKIGNIIYCTSCRDRFNDICQRIMVYKSGQISSSEDFATIDFKRKFDDFVVFCKDSVSFLQLFDTSKSDQIIKELQLLYWIYYAQMQAFPEYQMILQESYDISSTKAYNISLRKITAAKNKAIKEEVDISEDKKISLQSLPYYNSLISALDSKHSEISKKYRKDINDILSNCRLLLDEYTKRFFGDGKSDINSFSVLLEKIKIEKEILKQKFELYNVKGIEKCISDCSTAYENLQNYIDFISPNLNVIEKKNFLTVSELEEYSNFLNALIAKIDDLNCSGLKPYQILKESLVLNRKAALDLANIGIWHNSLLSLSKDKLFSSLPALKDCFGRIKSCNLRLSDFDGYVKDLACITNAIDNFYKTSIASDSDRLNAYNNFIDCISDAGLGNGQFIKDIIKVRDELENKIKLENEAVEKALAAAKRRKMIETMFMAVLVIAGIALGAYFLFGVVLPFLWGLFIKLLKIVAIVAIITGVLFIIISIFSS